jgi:hypothetical protein
MDIKTNALETYVGLNINDICPNCYAPANNCAHFVSHVLNLQIHGALTCKDMTKGAITGACLRVDDIYNYCDQAGPWEDRPSNNLAMLAFIASNGVDSNNCMVKVPFKHVGVYSSGYIYHHAGGGAQGKVYKHWSEKWLSWMSYPKGSKMYFGILA